MTEDTAWLDDVSARLRERGLMPADGGASYHRLTGGVSSDIWLVAQGARKLVVKRALSRLRVQQEWLAPLSRNATEARWLRTAYQIVPDAVPEVVFEDHDAEYFAMAFVDPARAPVWKAELLEGRIDAGFAAKVGQVLGGIHAATASRPDIAAQFENAATFHALRISPYFEATAERHHDLAPRIRAVASASFARRDCLIHGDVSPKNILIASAGPIILDAECATYGDPAFDLAFCLNHLLLKGVVVTDIAALGDAFAALAAAYLEAASSLNAAELEERTADLLPALLLARIDGKSPVEYITADRERVLIRDTSRQLFDVRTTSLREVYRVWAERVGSLHGD